MASHKFYSVSPACMSKRRFIQCPPNLPPAWQIAVHQGVETVIVIADEKMHHFVHENVLKAFRRLLRQLGIEANASRLWVAAPPFRFHLLYEWGRSNKLSFGG